MADLAIQLCLLHLIITEAESALCWLVANTCFQFVETERGFALYRFKTLWVYIGTYQRIEIGKLAVRIVIATCRHRRAAT